MKAVILAGGLGTRMREETEFKPKPMVEIGGKPVLWHIMNSFALQGIRDFVILAGYRANMVKDYFLNLEAYTNDFTVSWGENREIELLGGSRPDWSVTVLDTGIDSETGGRLAQARAVLAGERFVCTYGDGLASVSIRDLIRCHSDAGTVGTVTVTKPTNRFGIVRADAHGRVLSFEEKPQMADLVNIGYFVFEPNVFDFIDEKVSLERGLLRALVGDSQLAAYEHLGFWEPMDTYREFRLLNDLWNRGERPWVPKND